MPLNEIMIINYKLHIMKKLLFSLIAAMFLTLTIQQVYAQEEKPTVPDTTKKEPGKKMPTIPQPEPELPMPTPETPKTPEAPQPETPETPKAPEVPKIPETPVPPPPPPTPPAVSEETDTGM